MEKKYELGKKESNGLYRVIAIKDFGDVSKGDVGGFVKSEENLSQLGNAWVFGDAMVFGKARVYDEAMVYGKARVYDNAWVFGDARVFGEARVFGNARVYGDAMVYDNAKVYGDATVYGDAMVFGDARVYGDATVYGDAMVYDEARIFSGFINKYFDKDKNKIKFFRYELAKQLGITTLGDKVYLFKKVNKTENKNKFKSLYDSSFVYEIGKISKVSNPDMSDRSCSSGLHCGTALYHQGGDTLLEVEVKLKDIITIQEAKVRCKALKVIGVVDIN
jgi:hypothetical protein